MLKQGPIQIFVSDIEKAKKWYTDILGLELVEEYNEWKCAFLKIDNIEFEIGEPNESWGFGWKKAKALVGKQIGVFFETDDINREVKRLKEKGVEIVLEPQKEPWNETRAVLKDLDGNFITLVQRG